ncbi:hypothetical protein GOV13_03965 [Candidatus Pacearchaeota archaeon]|nr:hypothetical protein [Candidatus Pacearchaeota archaeon]
MLGNKHAFWQALVIALILFWSGILIGVFFENSRTGELKNFYFDSETDLFDFELSSEIVYESNLDCDLIVEKNIFFADKIYLEAIKMEKYDNSNKITEELLSLHRRYDFLRTLLWKDIIENKEKCVGEVNTVIYLYQYKNPTITQKTIQGTMSNFLIDLKEEHNENIILIPIAVDTNIESLEILRELYGLENFPAIFVNEKHKFETLDSLGDLERYLD